MEINFAAEQYSSSQSQWGDYLNSSFHHGREQEPEWTAEDDEEYDEWLASIQPQLAAEQSERERKNATFQEFVRGLKR